MPTKYKVQYTITGEYEALHSNFNAKSIQECIDHLKDYPFEDRDPTENAKVTVTVTPVD